MRPRLALLVLPTLLAASSARPESWEIEASLGVTSGDQFTRRAPFEYRGLSFRGPYNVCQLPFGRCPPGAEDVGYSLRNRYPITGIAAVDARRHLSRAISVAVGVQAGIAQRRQTLFRSSTGDIVYSRPAEPASLQQAFGDAQAGGDSAAGVRPLAYLHAGLRHEHRFESRSGMGLKPSSLSVFVEGGGGLLVATPGAGEAGFGRPAAVHVAIGLRRRRQPAKDLVFSLIHVQALVRTAPLLDAQFRWTGVRVGIVWGVQ